MAAIRLQLLLRPEHRNPAGVEAASKVVETLGFETTGKGRTSLSARVNEQEFEQLFGAKAAVHEPLPVPQELAEYVESITVAPRHEYL